MDHFHPVTIHNRGRAMQAARDDGAVALNGDFLQIPAQLAHQRAYQQRPAISRESGGMGLAIEDNLHRASAIAEWTEGVVWGIIAACAAKPR